VIYYILLVIATGVAVVLSGGIMPLLALVFLDVFSVLLPVV